jgi:HEPN domain-containing protein
MRSALERFYMQPDHEFAIEWLHKAKNDLLAAKAVLKSEYGITDIPCFHAQQTVEKALKGFLTYNHISFSKTHDLMIILAQVIKITPELEKYRNVCEELSTFAVDIRYPGGISEPPAEETRRFIKKAE